MSYNYGFNLSSYGDDLSGFNVDQEESHTPSALQSLLKGLTVRGSTMASDLADSWFGLGTQEEKTVEGPSILERHINSGEEDPLVVPAPSLLLWDPTQLDLSFGTSSSPAVPRRTGRRKLSSFTSGEPLLPDASSSSFALGSHMDFEMDELAPPELPPRDPTLPRGSSIYENGTMHGAGRGIAMEESAMGGSDFWSNPDVESAPVPPSVRPQARGRGKGAPVRADDHGHRKHGKADKNRDRIGGEAMQGRPQPNERRKGPGPATLRNIEAIAPTATAAHKKHPVGKTSYWPIFILLVTAADIGVLIAEIVYNDGLESFQVNPFFGPSQSTLKTFGAKWAWAIKEKNEAWRFFTAMFLHVGILHLLVNVVVQLRLGWTLERQIGWFRVVPIYILSGFAGNLASCIFLPGIITVGASGAAFGLYGVLVADLILNWGIVERPWLKAIYLSLGIAGGLAVGILPGLDNFAHIGGLVQGFLAGLILLPSLAARVKHCYRLLRWLILLLLPPINAVGLAIGLVVFYYAINTEEQTWCDICKTIDCVPVLDWCQYDSA